MKATKRIRKLLKDLKALTESSGPEADEEEGAQETPYPMDDTVASDSEPDISESSPLESSTCDGTNTSTTSGSFASKVLYDEVERLVQELGHSRVLVATLEAEIKVLRHEKEDQHDRDNVLIERLEAELKRLEQQAQVELAALKSRQQQIELDGPDTEQKLKALKEVLHDLNVSEPLYAELSAVPEGKRSVKAHIQILAYEKMRALREEIETLRMERDMSRESLTRENEDMERMQREVQRITATAAMEKKEIEKEMSALAARNERFLTELNEALVKVEVLSAKGAMYDEIKDKLDKAEQSVVNAENQRAVITATLQVVTDEKQRLLEVIKDKDHCLDLLSMDKIYLSREVKGHTDQVKKLEKELQQQQEKLRALKNTRQELYNRVLTDNRDSLAAHEQRLQAELARLQEQASRDIERIRKEATEVAEEKVKTYRELRDAALAEAERLQAIQRENKSNYDELLTKYQELRRVSEAKEIQARSDIKIRDFELEQLRIAQQEITCKLNQKSIENDALAEKVKVLTQEYHKRELEIEKPAALLRNELEMTRRKLELYESQALHNRNRDKENLCEDTSSERKKRPLPSAGVVKSREDGQPVFRNTAVHTSGRVTPRRTKAELSPGKNDFCERANKGVHDRDNLLEQVLTKQANRKDVDEENGKKASMSEETNIIFHSDIKKARTQSEHMCQRLHNLQVDLRKILETRGTLESFQSLLREKGIHISDNVIKKITKAKEAGKTRLVT